MRKSRFTEERIVGILQEYAAGAKVSELCCKYGMSDATLYKWKAKYGAMTASELRRLKDLEAESSELKRLLSDATLDNAGLKGVGKKLVTPAARRDAVVTLMAEHQFTQRRACRLPALVGHGSLIAGILGSIDLHLDIRIGAPLKTASLPIALQRRAPERL